MSRAASGKSWPAAVKSLAPRPIGADIENAGFSALFGSGGQSTTNSRSGVVAMSWILSWIFARKIRGLTPRTTARQQIRPPYMCACLRLRMIAICLSCCRAVVSYLNSLKDKKNIHDKIHDISTTPCRAAFNPLKMFEKGGFARG